MANIKKSIRIDRTEIQVANIQSSTAESSKITVSVLSPIKEFRAANPSKEVDLKVSTVNDNTFVISIIPVGAPIGIAGARSIDLFEVGTDNSDTLLGSLPIVGVLPSAVDIFPHEFALGTISIGKAKELDLVVTSKLDGEIEASSNSPDVESVSTDAFKDFGRIVRVKFIPKFIGAITTVVNLNIRVSKSTESYDLPISVRYYGVSE